MPGRFAINAFIRRYWLVVILLVLFLWLTFSTYRGVVALAHSLHELGMLSGGVTAAVLGIGARVSLGLHMNGHA